MLECKSIVQSSLTCYVESRVYKNKYCGPVIQIDLKVLVRPVQQVCLNSQRFTDTNRIQTRITRLIKSEYINFVTLTYHKLCF